MTKKKITPVDNSYVITVKSKATKLHIDFNQKVEQDLFIKVFINGIEKQNKSISFYRSAMDNPKFLIIPQEMEKNDIIELKFEGVTESFEIEAIGFSY